MSQTINIYSKKDIERFIDEELIKKFHAYNVLLNTLHSKVNDLDRIIRGLENDRRRNKRRTNRKS
jgi:low affinity Fe/Cu permease